MEANADRKRRSSLLLGIMLFCEILRKFQKHRHDLART